MIYNPISILLSATIGATAILLAHGFIVPLTWRLTDSATGRLWLSFGVVLVATSPARMDTLPVWLCIVTVLVCTVAFYMALDRLLLLPAPHVVRQTSATSGGKTWVDNRKPFGYRWLNLRVRRAWA